MGTRDEILSRYDKWQEQRAELSAADTTRNPPSSSSWQNSDDAAVDIMHEMGHLLERQRKGTAAVLEAAQEAQDAAYGDSNDSEIDLLREALDAALGLLNLTLPEGRDPDDEEGGD